MFEDLFPKDNPYINYLQQVMDTMVNEFPKDSQGFEHDNSGWTAAAGYLGPMFIYTYLKNKDNELVAYHANQACILFACSMLNNMAGKIPVVGGIIKRLGATAIMLLSFMGAKNAVAKSKTPLPIVGSLNISILK